MATLTTNLSLTKPATTDFYDIAVQNTNMDLLDTAVAGKASSVHVHPIYAICATAAATKAKTVTLSDFALSAGALVTVQFTNGNTNSAMTLNVNSTGAKNILWQNGTDVSFPMAAGTTLVLVYNGTAWLILSGDSFVNPYMKSEVVSYTGTGTYVASDYEDLSATLLESDNATKVLSSFDTVVAALVSGGVGNYYILFTPATSFKSTTYSNYSTRKWGSHSLVGNALKLGGVGSDPQFNASGTTYSVVFWGY